MKYKLLVLVSVLILVLIVPSCKYIGAERTVTGTAPPLEQLGTSEEKAYGSFCIYPGYNVDAFIVGKSTAYMTFTVGSDLRYDSIAEIRLVQPLDSQLAKNEGCVRWDNFTDYCTIIMEADNALVVPALGTKEITLKLQVPEGVDMPDKWMFYVAYKLAGHEYGNYQITSNSNIVFFPSYFASDITDNYQKFTWITWGNFPKVIVRAKVGSPITNMNDGELVYEGTGEQIIQQWFWEDEGKWLDRQYTKFTILDNELLSYFGGDKLFYAVWYQRIINNTWQGEWNRLDESKVIPEVQQKVIVSK